MDESTIFGCHPWMEKGHLWMSSMDGEISSMDESVIRGCHPWMTLLSVDVIHGWHPRMEMTDDKHERSKRFS